MTMPLHRLWIAALFLLALPAVVQAQFTLATNNNSVTIIGYTGSGGAVVIPEIINGYPVTGIGIRAFDSSSVTAVTIPDSVTNIGESAFEFCYSLAYIAIPDSVTSIGVGAFGYCVGLTNVTIPGSVTSMGQGAFIESGLVSATVADGVTSIGDSAFQQCSSLASIAIPNSVTNIGAFAFWDCTKLSNIAVPDNVTIIADDAFSGSGLINVTIPSSVTLVGQQVFQYCLGLTNVVIANGVTRIGVAEFDQCSGLASVTIPPSVTSIGVDAFNYCFSLKSMIISANIASIGGSAFANCTSLTNLSVAATNQQYSSTNGVLFNKNYDAILQYPAGLTSSTYAIPNGVTYIGPSAFEGCSFLASVTIPEGITNIASDAFYDCTRLASITIPGSVTNIGSAAFQDCTNLTSAYFEGDAPPNLGNAFAVSPTTVYFLPGTTGWGTTFGGAPTMLWLPQIAASGASFGVRTNQFGFNIDWSSNEIVVVEASTNLTDPIWLPIATNTLAGGSFYFSDPQWTNYPDRFYRVSAQ